MKAYLTFYKKSSQFLGVSFPLESEIEEIPSGCPVIVVVDHDFIKCVYRVGTNGEINQIYGFQDYLIQIEEILDLSYKYLKIYHYIRFTLENLFRELLLDELIKNKKANVSEALQKRAKEFQDYLNKQFEMKNFCQKNEFANR